MRLIVDCLVVKPGQAGLRSYALAIVNAMNVRADVDLTVLASQDSASDWEQSVSVELANLSRNSAASRAIWRRLHLRKLVRRLGASAVLTVSPEWAPAGVPTVIVVHDIGPAIAPALYGRARAARYALTLGQTVRKASSIVTVSAATKLDLIRWVGPSFKGKIHAVRNAGASQPIAAAVDSSAVPEGSFGLYVGAYLPHKNVEVILSMFARGADGLPEFLVCVGPDYAGEKENALAPYADAAWLVSPGFVNDAQLAALYQHADVVLYPSLFEGFGLPIVEALQHKRRVVATRLPVFEEAAGQLPEYVDDPLSVSAWERVVLSPADHARGRSETRDATLARSWSHVADEVVEVVKGVIASAEDR